MVDVIDCPIVEIETIESIRGADKIELARCLGFQIIIPHGQFDVGDKAALLVPDAVLPPALAFSLLGRAKLFGEARNRVRAFRLKETVSDGLLLGPLPSAVIGTNAAPTLGIKKYEPAEPFYFMGECARVNDPYGGTIDFDIKSFRRYPKIILEDEDVEVSEKIHGTMCAISFIPRLNDARFLGGDTLIYSKTLGRRRMSLTASPRNEHNPYVRMVRRLNLRQRIIDFFGFDARVTVLGEIYGPNIQDLDYGLKEPSFSMFDIFVGPRPKGRFLDRREMDAVRDDFPARPPVLYRGPFHRSELPKMASGPSVAGKGKHIREGVVIRASEDRWHPKIGRVMLKYVSQDYLTRRDGTEFH
jgi:RNA ligase (TIGR02306 family)